MIILHRGDEWCTIQDLDSESCLWLYCVGKEGNGRSVSPISVKETQVEAHVSKGWEVV